MSGCALVVNCSAPLYNLGAAKLANWLRASGYSVDEWKSKADPGLLLFGYDLVCLSVIFSWDAVKARDLAIRLRSACEVWAGGPGLYQLQGWWKRETGSECVARIDERFDKARGDYLMTFASRGCPVGCYFCIVPRLEGKEFTLDWDFHPASVLCDNNLSALPVEFQEHIIRRYQESGVILKDANSGFEPRAFDAETYRRWKPVLRGPWRFAFDEMSEEADVKRMMQILANEPASKKRVYVLCGNEPIASCHERAQKVIEWGGEPFCQYVLPLNWLGDPAELRNRFDWTYQKGRDFCRYYNRWIWRSAPIEQYQPRQDGVRPFQSFGASKVLYVLSA
jgi:hypothetical protein